MSFMQCKTPTELQLDGILASSDWVMEPKIDG